MKFDFDVDECPSDDCENTDKLIVLAVVRECARHSEGKHTFESGGDVIMHERVDCDVCDATLWNNQNERQEIDKDWSSSHSCTNCGSTSITEKHIDCKITEFDGSFRYDADRLATVEYKCRNCDETLSRSNYEPPKP
jgi:ribosomal protein L37AE/L43A